MMSNWTKRVEEVEKGTDLGEGYRLRCAFKVEIFPKGQFAKTTQIFSALRPVNAEGETPERALELLRRNLVNEYKRKAADRYLSIDHAKLFAELDYFVEPPRSRPNCEGNFVKVTHPDDSASYIDRIENLPNLIEGELEGAFIGSSFTITVVDMTEEEYEAMPEFTGW